MDCKEVSKKIDEMMLDEYLKDSELINEHVSKCGKCMKNMEDSKLFIKAINTLNVPEVDDGLHLKVLGKIKAERNKKNREKLRNALDRILHPESFALKGLMPAMCAFFLVFIGYKFYLQTESHLPTYVMKEGTERAVISECLLLKNKEVPFSLALTVDNLNERKISISIQSEKEGFIYLFAINSENSLVNLWREKESRITSYQQYDTKVLRSELPRNGKIIAILLKKEDSFTRLLEIGKKVGDKNIISKINKKLKGLESGEWMINESEYPTDK